MKKSPEELLARLKEDISLCERILQKKSSSMDEKCVLSYLEYSRGLLVEQHDSCDEIVLSLYLLGEYIKDNAYILQIIEEEICV